MKYPFSKTQQIVSLVVLLVVLLGTWWFIHTQKTTQQSAFSATVVTDAAAGLEFSLPSGYKSFQSNKSNPDQSPQGLIGNYVRAEPTAFLTVRYDTGLRSVTNLLHRGTLEHIEADIANFFPVKYTNYQAIETKHINVTGRESIEHKFRYTLPNGGALQTLLVAVPFSDDVAYYLILQATPADFDAVQTDLDAVKDSLKLTDPKTATKSS